jgi:RNA polymerase sigma-70 factor (ECF subfamily)
MLEESRKAERADAPPAPSPGAGETRRLIADFLADSPAAITTVSGWARAVAVQRAWGFDTPEDIVQSTLLALVRNLRAGRFEGDALRPYVRRIAKNLCVSSYRSRRRHGTEVPLGDGTPGNGDDGPAAVTPVAGGLDAEQRTFLDQVLASLDEPCREIILAAYVEGLDRKEIAEQLGISEGAARVRLFRCLERARQRAGSAGGGS